MGIEKEIQLFAKLTKRPGWEPSGSFSNRKSGVEASVPPLRAPARDGGRQSVNSSAMVHPQDMRFTGTTPPAVPSFSDQGAHQPRCMAAQSVIVGVHRASGEAWCIQSPIFTPGVFMGVEVDCYGNKQECFMDQNAKIT